MLRLRRKMVPNRTLHQNLASETGHEDSPRNRVDDVVRCGFDAPNWPPG